MRNKNDDFSLFPQGQNQGQGKGDYTYYEDTHDAKGNYTGGIVPFSGKLKPNQSTGIKPNQGYQPQYQQPQQQQFPQGYPQQQQFPPIYPQQQPQQQMPQQPPQQNQQMFMPYGTNAKQYYETPKSMPQQPKGTFAPSNKYNNMVVYEPRTPSDVQQLIDYLKRKEPAIINLDSVDEESAQRILDFFSGAVYALNGSIHRISGNIFLLTPEGVVITAPI